MRWVMLKPGESIWRCAVRSTAFFGLVFPLAVVGVACILVPLLNMKPTGFARLTAKGPMLLWCYLIMLMICFLGPPSAEAVHRAIWGPVKRYGLAVWICLLYLLSVFAVCVWFRWEALDRYFVMGPDLWAWAGVAAVTPVLLIISSRQDYLEQQRYYRWTSLDFTE